MWFSSTANVRVRLPSSVKAMSSFCPESATRFHTPKRVSLLIDTVGGPLSTTLKSQVSHKFRRKTVVGKWDRVACTFQWMLRNSSAALSKSSNVSWAVARNFRLRRRFCNREIRQAQCGARTAQGYLLFAESCAPVQRAARVAAPAGGRERNDNAFPLGGDRLPTTRKISEPRANVVWLTEVS